MKIFLDDTDYRKFFFVLGDAVEAFDIECWDYCAMPNHYHLSLYPRKANLSRAIGYLNGVYGTWWNARHAKVGHVFQGRFKAQIVQREGYLPALCRYIARNPVRAKLVDDPAQWRWSSFGPTAGLLPRPGFLFSDPILKQFGDGDLRLLQRCYRQHVLGESADNSLEERLRSKERLLGDRAFKLRILSGSRDSGADRELATDGFHRTGISGSPYLADLSDL